MDMIFKKLDINGMRLKNRFVRSATWEGMAGIDGAVTSALIETMTALARGGVGLIISGHAYVSEEGQAGPWQLGAYKDTLVPGLEKMARAVREAGGKIVLQLAHAGHFAAKHLTGRVPVVASDYPGLAGSPRHTLSVADIGRLTGAYAAAAGRAQDAGFDGVQLHAAHGYLLSQFLSPIFNRRTDAYGGDIAGRTTIIREILAAVRDRVGGDYPVMIKLNCRDFADGGLTAEDSMSAAQILATHGIDAIELSGGLLTGKRLSPSRVGINRPDREAYFKQDARIMKKSLDIPLILVGGIRSLGVARQILAEGTADAVSMSRPLIREPDLVSRWRSGDHRPAKCTSDNLCFGPAREGKGIYCVTAAREAATPPPEDRA